MKKVPQPCTSTNSGLSGTNSTNSLHVKTTVIVPPKVTSSIPRRNEFLPSNVVAVPAPCSMEMSPSKSDDVSVSLDETMSTCDSFKSPEVEYIDNNDVPVVSSLTRKTFSNLYISDHSDTTGNINCCCRMLYAKFVWIP